MLHCKNNPTCSSTDISIITENCRKASDGLTEAMPFSGFAGFYGSTLGIAYWPGLCRLFSPSLLSFSSAVAPVSVTAPGRYPGQASHPGLIYPPGRLLRHGCPPVGVTQKPQTSPAPPVLPSQPGDRGSRPLKSHLSAVLTI